MDPNVLTVASGIVLLLVLGLAGWIVRRRHRDRRRPPDRFRP